MEGSVGRGHGAGCRIFFAVFLMVVLFGGYACTDGRDSEKEPVFRQVPEIREIRPQKPVKIKLKRNSNGSYSWELTGDNADKIIEADRKLRKSLPPNP
ncbi:MAG: hypothetical protein GXP46_10375 [Deferribacteres bacterium]|nr:hypothetical protein [Deferribacteres bacterium]